MSTLVSGFFKFGARFYALGMSGLVIVRHIIGERWVVVSMYNTAPHLLLFPTVMLLPLALWRRRWSMVSLLLPGVAAFTLAYAPLVMPPSISAPPDSTMLSLLSYNIGVREQDVERLITVIRQANADVVALQELGVGAAARFADELAPDYPFQALHPCALCTAGQGILSRFPLLADDYWTGDDSSSRLGHQRVELAVNDQTLTLYNVHLNPPLPALYGRFYNDGPRRGEVAELLEKTERDTGAVVLLGDFNMSDRSNDYHRIVRRFSDAHRQAGRGFGFTFPNFSHLKHFPSLLADALPLPPLLRLDYVFYNDALVAISSQVWRDSGDSDHYPLYTGLALLPG